MSDHDPLESFTRETTQQVLAPDFDTLVTVSRRRRRASLLATGCAVAAVAGIVAVGVQAVGSDDGTRNPIGPPPSVTHRTPTPPGTDQARAAETLVQSSKSYLSRLAISRDDPDVRAAVWGHGVQEAVAVTTDAFVTAHYLRVASLTDLVWAGGDSFLVRLRSGQLVSVSVAGDVRDITPSDQVSPLRATEALFTSFVQKSGEPQYVAVDGQAATSHPIPVPYPSAKDLQLRQGEGQTIWGTVSGSQFRPTLVSSADGGATWHNPVVAPGPEQLDPIDSAALGTLAVVGAGDDDFKVGQDLRRSTDGGQTWQALHPTALRGTNPGWLAVRSDGRLLVWVISTFGGATLTPGLYESDSTNWQSFHRVTVTSQDGPAGDLRVTVVDRSGRQALYVQARAGLIVSTDGGRTWSPTEAR